MKPRAIILIMIVLSVRLAACASNPEEANKGWQPYQDDELGISFELPDTWVTQEGDGVITIANDQVGLDTEISSGAGASITLATSGDFDGFSDPVDILGLFIDFFENGRPNLERIGDPEIITIQDLPAATVTFRGDVREQSGLFTATIISNAENIALVLTIDGSAGEEYQEILERLTQSISVYGPVE